MTIQTRMWLHGLGSAAITGLSTSFLSSLGISGANACGVNVSQLDLRQMVILTVIGGLVGGAAYLQKSPLPDEPNATPPTIKLSGIWLPFCLCLILTGCATKDDGSIDAGQTAVNATEFAMPIFRPAAEVACKVLVLDKATDPADKIEKAKYIYGVASCLRSLMGGKTPTSEQLENALWSFTPDKQHWADLASSFTGLWEQYYKQLGNDPKLAMEALEQLASGCERAAEPYIK